MFPLVWSWRAGGVSPLFDDATGGLRPPLAKLRFRLVILEIIVPAIIELLERLRQRDGSIVVAVLLDDAKTHHLFQRIADLKVDFQLGVAFEVHLDVVVK